MSESRFDLVVIGAGPGGYVAAIRAAQLGWNVACVEKEPELGGTCLRVGCIPSKALLESSERYAQTRNELAAHGIRASAVEMDVGAMLARKEKIVQGLTEGVAQLFAKNKITRFQGHGRLAGPGAVQVETQEGRTDLSASHILVATGSRPAFLPGVRMDTDRIGTSTEALSYPEPPKHLVVVGAGYIGLEMGAVWSRLGSKVTVLEFLPRILPGMDAELASAAQKTLARQGLEFRLGAEVTGVRANRGKCRVDCKEMEPIECDRVLVAIGRAPVTDDLGLETVGVTLDVRGRITVDESFATSAAGVYAIGDVIGGAMLAHKAEEEGIACVERLITGYGHVDYDSIPGIVYTHPEIASVGKTEEALKEAGVEYRKGKFQFRANGRARCMGETDGFAKILADANTDRVLGAHIIGPRAGDLIAEMATAIVFGASSEDIARASHAHPTLAEVVKEAALDVDGRAIHA